MTLLNIALFVIPCLAIIVNGIERDNEAAEAPGRWESNRSCWENCTYDEAQSIVNCNGSGCKTIPSEIPVSTRILIMANNNITVIKRESFENLTNLIQLDLFYCHIQTIEDGVFDKLTNLLVLNISRNSKIEKYPAGFFSKMSNLTHMIMTQTIKSMTFNESILDGLSNLEVFAFGENQLMNFPKFLDDQQRSIVPKLKELYLETNNFEKIVVDQVRGLESLEKLVLSDNRIHSIHDRSFANLTNLKQLELDMNVLNGMHCDAFWSTSITFLSLASCKYYTGNKCNKEENFFDNIPNLKRLKLSHSGGFFQVAGPFSYNTSNSIEELDFVSLGIMTDMLENLTRNLPNLRRLNLHNNDINYLIAQPFRHLTNLSNLNIGYNWIITINATSLPMTLWETLEHVDFGGNPLFCDCGIVWFRQWGRRRNATIDHKDLLVCAGPPEVKVKSVLEINTPTYEECFRSDPDWLFPILLFLVLSVITSSTVASLLYRFRWHLKYWHFKRMIKKKVKEVEENDTVEVGLQFDAFISYSDSDSRWVARKLSPRLENDFRLRLCIHDRDWALGRDVIDNVIESIEQSSKTIFVVSNAFAISNWCHFEMTMAQSRLFQTNRDNLILVLLEEIADFNMNPRLQLELEKRNYIEWTENRVGQQLFWARLKEALGNKSGAILQSLPPRELFASQRR